MRKILVLPLLLLACASCAPRSEPSARAQLTQRQRDSVLAESRLPGATVVGRALSNADREAQRAAGVDAEMDSLFR